MIAGAASESHASTASSGRSPNASVTTPSLTPPIRSPLVFRGPCGRRERTAMRTACPDSGTRGRVPPHERKAASGVSDVGIGIVGYGMTGRAHAYGYTVAPRIRDLLLTPRLRAISGRHADAVARAASRYGVEQWTTDWRELVERPDVDIVDVCTPPGTHAEIVEAAVAAGKAGLCEKPLAADYASARRAADAARAAGVPNAIGFNYRRLPALSLLKRMVDDGAVGEVLLWRGTWLSDEFLDPQLPFDWRFERRMGGS